MCAGRHREVRSQAVSSCDRSVFLVFLRVTCASVATQKAMDAYIESSYKAGKVCCVVYAGEGSRLTICVSAKNVHLGNFWSVCALFVVAVLFVCDVSSLLCTFALALSVGRSQDWRLAQLLWCGRENG